MNSLDLPTITIVLNYLLEEVRRIRRFSTGIDAAIASVKMVFFEYRIE